jgi:hypothetical protein
MFGDRILASRDLNRNECQQFVDGLTKLLEDDKNE